MNDNISMNRISMNHNINISHNDTQSDEEKHIMLDNVSTSCSNTNDIILQKAMEEFSSDGLFMIKFGKTPRDKERECYAGFIITEDTGKIFGNQLVFPGCKSMKLPKAALYALNKIGLYEGHTFKSHTLTIEQTAWWAEKSKRHLLHTLLKHISGVKILTMDHLGKNMDLNWAIKLAENGYIVAPGAAGETPSTQINDMNCNGFYDKGVVHLNNVWSITSQPNTIPTMA
eukprot:57780_1